MAALACTGRTAVVRARRLIVPPINAHGDKVEEGRGSEPSGKAWHLGLMRRQGLRLSPCWPGNRARDEAGGHTAAASHSSAASSRSLLAPPAQSCCM
eukprot:7694827-Heterocapsa_arctica.AAC.1